MIIRRPAARTLAALLVTAALLAGCGGSSGVSNSPQVNDAVNQCLTQAKQVQDANARRTATEACKAAKSGDTKGVKDAARQQCLAATKQIPDAKSRKTAEDRCRTATK